MKKSLSVVLSLILAGAILAGCGNSANNQPPAAATPAPQAPVESAAPAEPAEPAEPVQSNEPKEINWGREYDMTTMDVHEASDNGSYDILYLVGEGLVRNDGGVITPGVAERWEASADGMEYTFYLRSDAKWSDGSPLTANDFKYSYMRMLDPEAAHYNADSAFMFKNGEKYFNGEASADEVGIEVVDDHTLKIVREESSLETLYALAKYQYAPVSQTMVETAGVAYGAEAGNVLTNGPFTVTKWEHESKITLEKNDSYWNKDKINLTKITGIVGALGETAVDMLLVGELDIIESRDYDKVQELIAGGYKAESYTSTYQLIHMNSGGGTAESARFMANTNFRKAINYAVNRQAITSSVFKAAAPSTRITSPNEYGVSGQFISEYPYEAWPTTGDAAKAKEHLDLALAELGATIDEVPELSMLCFEAPSSMNVLQAVQDMLLSTLNIKAKIDPQPIQQMISKALGGEWDFWWGGIPVGDVDWGSDGSLAGNYDSTRPENYNNYKNEAYDALFKKMETTLDMKERKDTLFELEKILCEDPGAIVLGWVQAYDVYRGDLTGSLVSTRFDMTYMDIVK